MVSENRIETPYVTVISYTLNIILWSFNLLYIIG